MKLKSLFLSAGILLAGILASCSSDDPEVIVYEAGMTSFGFYVEDNEGLIVQDYEVSPVTQTNITLLLPEEVDKSKLVARFTVTDNDVVKVGDVVQQSGVTVNDFTVPVDYFVSEGTKNVKYTVTIGKAPAYVWTALPPVTGDSAVSLVMKVSPDGTPYIAYKMERETSADEALGVLVLKDGAWSSLGKVSEGRVGSYMDITFNATGMPTVSYLDYTNKISQQASVKALNGTTWSFVGGAEATSNKVSYHTLNYVGDKLMLMATYDAKDNVLARRELSVNTYGNGAWTYNATIPGRPSDLVAYLEVSEKLGDVLYLGVYNAVSPNSVSVYKFENNTWTALVDKWSDEKATAISLRDFDIAVDKQGDVYVALSDNSADGVYKIRVIKYDAETKQIVPVGNPITAATGSSLKFDLALSPLGVPYLFYRNETNFPTVVSLDKDTQDWTEPLVLEANEANDLHLGFAPDGKAYLVFTKSRKIFSYKYDAPGQ